MSGRIILVVTCLLSAWLSNARAESAAGADLELVCPCTFSSTGGSTATGEFGVVNRAGATGELIVRAYAHSETNFRESNANDSGIFLGDFEVTGSLGAGETLPVDTYQATVFPPSGQFYVTLLLLEDLFIVDETRTSERVNFNASNYSAASVDYLLDTDGDGIADDNERFMGTDKDSALSRPGTSQVDVLVVFHQETLDFYEGDVTARMDHLFAVSNQALDDSGVDMQLRIAGYEQVDFDDSLSIDGLLNAASSEQGAFSNLQDLREAHNADLVAVVRNDDGGDFCGLATLGGFPTQGLVARTEYVSVSIIDFDFCGDITLVHEMGHNMGLGHSYRQDEVGTFIWARGHGEDNLFATIMAYASEFNLFSELPYFSNPDSIQCGGNACGVDINDPEPANAALSLNIVRHQVAAFTEAPETDTDNDGEPDSTDTDDDNDGIPDEFETGALDPLDASDALEDADGDGVSNLTEYETGTDPNDPLSFDRCVAPDSVGPDPADSTLPHEVRIAMANAGSNLGKESFLRFINRSSTRADVEVYGIDDSGTRGRDEAVFFRIAAGGSRHMTSLDLETGNAEKVLSGAMCDQSGKWHLVIRASQPVDVQSMIRSRGFLTDVSEVAPSAAGEHNVYFVNAGDETAQESFIRIVNNDATAGVVTISGRDDAGLPAGGVVTINLKANAAAQLSSSRLENGTSGATGAFGDGSGRWWVTVSSDRNLSVMSLVRNPGGFLTNMSAVAPADESGRTHVYFANPAGDELASSLLRLVNTSSVSNSIAIRGIDETGSPAPGGDVLLTLGPHEATLLTMGQLESGDSAAGLSGALGTGSGRWRLVIEGSASLAALSLIETADGFLSNMSSPGPSTAGTHQVLTLNPASNVEKSSFVRVVNTGSTRATISITGTDDRGVSAGPVSLDLDAGSSVDLDVSDLENGNPGKGLAAGLGQGSGRWRLVLETDGEISALGLMQTSTGLLSNLSQAVTP